MGYLDAYSYNWIRVIVSWWRWGGWELFRRKERCEWNYSKNMDIWNDDQTMMVLNGRHVLVDFSMNESAKIKKRLYYH